MVIDNSVLSSNASKTLENTLLVDWVSVILPDVRDMYGHDPEPLSISEIAINKPEMRAFWTLLDAYLLSGIPVRLAVIRDDSAVAVVRGPGWCSYEISGAAVPTSPGFYWVNRIGNDTIPHGTQDIVEVRFNTNRELVCVGFGDMLPEEIAYAWQQVTPPYTVDKSKWAVL